MLSELLKRIFGSRNERILRRLYKIVDSINAEEPRLQQMSDDKLRQQTQVLKTRLANGETLDAILPEAFATVREVGRRTMGLRHFDVQMIGGMVLHEGNIAEMRTGEGKTLVATLPVYLNALTGRGVHVVTVNDYLAKRDSEWMSPIYNFLGLTVGVVVPNMPYAEKKQAYACDIVYGTNNEFGFDYLRDNMAFSLEDKVQRQLNFAVVDEVDSILIDEARTPLIISGQAEDSTELYQKIHAIIPMLKQQVGGDNESGSEADAVIELGDFTLDLKQKQAFLTEMGHQNVEALLDKAGLLKNHESLYHASNIILMHHVNVALRAQHLFHKDVDYIVANDQIVIVDEHTGRTMPGRRWSEGLHQAIEAKEGVAIQHENQTLASITFQNYFRMYDKLSGMTGTADTEAYEFQQIYGLEVVVIPTNKPMVRKDEADLVYLSQQDKYEAIIEDIKSCIVEKKPVLVGTASIEASEYLSSLLHKAKIPHQVLNAKFHEQEAQIIAEAGRPGVVTIATNMAGRGTDIELGGSLKAAIAAGETEEVWRQRHDAVLAAGGLRIIGSERHESRRIDNQLRGRAGRQGDTGSSRFYLSLEDNLMRIFTSERVVNMMKRLGMQPGEPIEHSLVTKAIENAQRKLEGYHFDIRKQLLDYDNVANDQRRVIYQQRAEIMSMENTQAFTYELRHEVLSQLFDSYIPPESIEDQWDVKGLITALWDDYRIEAPIFHWIEADNQLGDKELKAKILALADELYQAKTTQVGSEIMTAFEKSMILQTLDNYWREHLSAMDHLRQGIHLRGYAQKDPKQEYKREAFNLFSSMIAALKSEIVRLISVVQIQTEADVEAAENIRREEAQQTNIHYLHDANEPVVSERETAPALKRAAPKIGRNEQCPCGSGRKFKACHGVVA